MTQSQEFEVPAGDGHRFGGSLFPADSPTAPLLMFMPAMGTRARYYKTFGAAMAAAGVSFACFDWRGIESSSLRASHATDFGYRHLIEHDLATGVRALRERLPQAPLWIGGHSLGGQLSTLYAALHPQDVRGLIVVASGNVHFRGWKGVGGLRILALTQSATLISRVVGHFPGKRLGFGGQEARGVIRDWAATARSGRYHVAGATSDYEAAMAKLEKPVLALGFTGDALAPYGSTERLLSKLPLSQRTHLRWSAADSAGVALDHFSWAKRPDLVVPTLGEWIFAQG